MLMSPIILRHFAFSLFDRVLRLTELFVSRLTLTNTEILMISRVNSNFPNLLTVGLQEFCTTLQTYDVLIVLEKLFFHPNHLSKIYPGVCCGGERSLAVSVLNAVRSAGRIMLVPLIIYVMLSKF
jgi:hypothetical protein